ncbi:MAG: SHOCT domain-containing protein [bacterium]
MALFSKKSDEEKKQKQDEALAAAEAKARAKAVKKGFDISKAIYVVEAMYPKDDEATLNMNMPLVAIFEDKVVQSRKSLLSSSLEEIPMKNISSVEITTGLLPTVNVYASGNTLTFRTDIRQGPRFVEILRECLANRSDSKSVGQISEVEKLEKLANLFEKGLLTKDEFEKEKKKLLET